ncbi:uncharacterized protein LOC117342149 [Pecten maximus]|uniref:uncharacterized protein LOC117342149 n=1 Tax=Pecten maximus TaxID=6579 RepID=UPI00145869AA|nr:uncharacterized protein LOC117342149 [Pecten maximus]
MFTERTFFLLLLGLLYLNTNGYSQLIGEEKKYVFLEQAVLERVRPAVLEMMEDLETRVGRLEEENKRILSELNLMRAVNPAPEMTNGCPTSDYCMIKGLICPSFYMDPATLHTIRYLSQDNLTLFNGGQGSTGLLKGTNRNRSYEGVQGSRVITNTQIIYFETEIYYRIKRDLSSTNLVFEVAFATETAIGKSHYVGRQMEAWSVNAHNNGSTKGVALFFKSNRGSILHSERLSDATSGAERNLILRFIINRVDRTIDVFYINTIKKVFTFRDVDGDQDLWPVFGVYQANKINGRIRLNSRRDITSFHCDRSR